MNIECWPKYLSLNWRTLRIILKISWTRQYGKIYLIQDGVWRFGGEGLETGFCETGSGSVRSRDCRKESRLMKDVAQ